MTSTKKTFYPSLQIYRGIAAMMVVFHHCWNQAEAFWGFENSNLAIIGSYGKHGVDFFFVLSGFIITLSNYHKSDEYSLIPKYYTNRVIRIFVPYLPVGILMLLLYNFLPSISAAEDGRSISLLTTFFLIPHGEPALSVAWTLVFEMLFYTIFLIWFLSSKIYKFFFGIWIFAILLFNLSGTYDLLENEFLRTFFSLYILEFGLGCLGAFMYINYVEIISKNRHVLIICGLILLFVLLFVGNGLEVSIWRGIQLTPIFMLLLIGSLNSRLDGLSSKNSLMILGNASYSIYLVHNICISALFRLLKKVDHLGIQISIFMVTIIISCIVGVIYSKIFEKWLSNLIRRNLAFNKA